MLSPTAPVSEIYVSHGRYSVFPRDRSSSIQHNFRSRQVSEAYSNDRDLRMRRENEWTDSHQQYQPIFRPDRSESRIRNFNEWRRSGCYQKNNIAPYRGSDRNRPRRGEDSSHISRLTQPKAKKSRWDVARSPSRCTSLQTPFGADNWPPNFEGYGSLYIFDPRCGMFYEPASNFFYDPTTKLYYSSKKGTYFQFDESKIPAFQAVKCTPEGAESSHAVHNTESEAFENNSKIELKIKPKKAKNLKPVTEARLPEIVLNQAQKKQLALMDQWSEKAKVTKAVSDRTLKKKRSALGGTASTVQDHGEVRKTAHGEPLCLLCLRKFTSVEKLRLHEMGSLLHKENSAKKSSLGKRNAAGSSEHLR